MKLDEDPHELEDSKKVEILIELKGDPEKICTSETKNSDSGTFLCFIASNFLMSGTEIMHRKEKLMKTFLYQKSWRKSRIFIRNKKLLTSCKAETTRYQSENFQRFYEHP